MNVLTRSVHIAAGLEQRPIKKDQLANEIKPRMINQLQTGTI